MNFRRGVALEYEDKTALLVGIRALRFRGLTRIEAYSPYPDREIDEALGARRSRLALAAGIGGLCGAVGGYFLEWFLVAYLYPIHLGQRPPHMPLAFVIITIEMGFLFGALAVFAAFLVASRLVKLWNPIDEVPGFESATRAGFWIAASADDPRFDRAAIDDAARGSGALRVAGFGGEP